MKHFYYLSDLGIVSLPDEKEINKIRTDKELLLILDSCVCLDIVNFINHKKNARVDKAKIFSLKVMYKSTM
ncbi:hypothetical protein GCM10009118_15940 [Wandonia haliotis]|uniref:Uncharacterized protein n=1 Tax=Wandonia haliotis TaxID=574963 RepID=A0ABN1MPH4_9FLAO